MSKVMDAYSGLFEGFGVSITETAQLLYHEHPISRWGVPDNYWVIKIWKNNVLPTSETMPSIVHVGKEKYIKRLWKEYKARRNL